MIKPPTGAECALLKKAEILSVDGARFTPTELGISVGHSHTQAASRVAPGIRRLVELGALERIVGPRSRDVKYTIIPNSKWIKA